MFSVRHQTSFSGGELSPTMLGRPDLAAYNNGATRLRNAYVLGSGAVRRRPGSRFVALALGDGRLAQFAFNETQAYLIVFTDNVVSIYANGTLVASIASPWDISVIDQLSISTSNDYMLVTHPNYPPKNIIRRADGTWNIADWEIRKHATLNVEYWPQYKFVAHNVTMSASATTGTVTLTTNADVFVTDHIGVRFRKGLNEMIITGVTDARHATASVQDTLSSTAATTDWTEQAWSAARGWPISVGQHQGRLVVGGSRYLPSYLWLSKSSDFYNFDVGTGLDDESIAVPLMSDQVNAIRAVHPGRQLQVYTAAGEWSVAGDPITPSSIAVKFQTGVGSREDRQLKPVDVDGATVFVAPAGGGIRQFVYQFAEDAYTAPDLSLLSDHLQTAPKAIAWAPALRRLHVVQDNGTMAVASIYRDQQVTAWAQWTAAPLFGNPGVYRSVAVVGGKVYALVQREGGYFIEVFDDALNTDSGLTGADSPAKTTWTGLGHLEGQTLRAVADGVDVGAVTVASGAITLAAPASAVEVGIAYPHTITDTPPFPVGQETTLGYRVRPKCASFHVDRSGPLRVAVGGALRSIMPGAIPYTGEIKALGGGWRKRGVPLWTIEDDSPYDFTLLRVSTEYVFTE